MGRGLRDPILVLLLRGLLLTDDHIGQAILLLVVEVILLHFARKTLLLAGLPKPDILSVLRAPLSAEGFLRLRRHFVSFGVVETENLRRGAWRPSGFLGFFTGNTIGCRGPRALFMFIVVLYKLLEFIAAVAVAEDLL